MGVNFHMLFSSNLILRYCIGPVSGIKFPLLQSLSYSVFTGKVKVKSLSRVQFFVTPWTVAYEAPPSMEFSRQ